MTAGSDPATPPGIDEAARRYQAQDYAGAAQCARAVIAANPQHFDALQLLAVLCQHARQWADAAAYLHRAVRLRPDDAEAQYHLGNALLGMQLYEAAEAAFSASIQLRAGQFDAVNNLGSALAGAGRHAQAIERFREALRLRPNAAPAMANLGRSLAALRRYDEAIQQFRAVLASGSDAPVDRLADVVADLCQACIAQARYRDALAACRDVPPQLFGHPVVEWNEGLTRLMLGDYREGWRLYEARFRVPGHDPPRPGAAVLDLTRVAGRRVLVAGEQGRGDIIQFARYLPLLAGRGATVIAEVYADLQPLVAAIDGVAQTVAPDDATPAHDLLTPLLSLPLAFATQLASIPAHVPYLAAPAERVRRWAARLGAPGVPRVALVWRGSSFSAPRTSIAAGLLTPLLDVAGIEFHALQKPLTPTDQDWLARHPAVRWHSEELHDFADAAALLEQMDLVISVDTAMAHLAGALARPVWILLPFSADWRWLAGRDDSPWYPTARLFRQARPGDWPGVMQRLAASLASPAYPIRASAETNPGFA